MLSPPAAEESHVRDPDWEARKAMNQVSICIYIYIHTYIYVYVCVCVFVCVCVCVYYM
jgi:hypothetical protein